MAKIRIDKMPVNAGMKDREMLLAMGRWMSQLVHDLEHILTNLSEENMNPSFLKRITPDPKEQSEVSDGAVEDGEVTDGGEQT